MIPPWSDRGWFGDAVRRGTDPAIKAIITEAGRGKVDAIGFEPGRPALAVSPATHSPYIAGFWGVMFVLVGVFLFVQMRDVLWAALLVGGLFWAGAGVVLWMSVRQIPSWHRARKAVKEYLKTHEGTFPRELRWYM